MERRVVVRFANEPDLVVGSNLSIREIKELIRLQRPALREKVLRLIHAGRVLEDADHVPLRETPSPLPALASGSSSAGASGSRTEFGRETGEPLDSIPLQPFRPNGKGRPASNEANEAIDGQGQIYLHCAASDFASEEPLRPTIRPQLGLERLLNVGFTEEEVASIRSQFHALRGTNVADEESARRLEETWIESNANNVVADNPFFGNSPGDLLKGLLIGFFFGILSVLLLREPVFNRRVQFGIMAGLLFNVSFGIAKIL